MKNKYSFRFVDKNIIWFAPMFIVILSFVNLFLLNYSSHTDQVLTEYYQNTPFFAPFKLSLALGLAFLMIGVMLENTTAFVIDVYRRKNDDLLFAHHWLVIAVKIGLTLLGLYLIVLFSLLENPPESEIDKGFWDYLMIGLALFFIVGMFGYMCQTIIRMIKNRNDYLRINSDSIEWFDRHYKKGRSFLFSEIESFTLNMEKTEKSPEVLGLNLHFTSSSDVYIDFKNMSLIPFSSIIIETLKKKIKEK